MCLPGCSDTLNSSQSRQLWLVWEYFTSCTQCRVCELIDIVPSFKKVSSLVRIIFVCWSTHYKFQEFSINLFVFMIFPTTLWLFISSQVNYYLFYFFEHEIKFSFVKKDNLKYLILDISKLYNALPCNI